MSKCVLFIDGENFNHKVMEVLKEEGLDKTKGAQLENLDLKRPAKHLVLIRN